MDIDVDIAQQVRFVSVKSKRIPSGDHVRSPGRGLLHVNETMQT